MADTRLLPTLTYDIKFPNPNQSKVSLTAPYNYVTIEFTCNMAYKYFSCFVTYEEDEEDYGINVGTKVIEYNDVASGVKKSFNLVANDYLTKGDGAYRIGLYVESNDGLWNYYYLFMTIGNKYIKTSDNKYLAVVAEGDIS